jgi:hypothetical protein
VLIDGQVADLIQDDTLGVEVLLELAFEVAAFLGGGQIVDDADGIGKEDGLDGKGYRRDENSFSVGSAPERDGAIPRPPPPVMPPYG